MKITGSNVIHNTKEVIIEMMSKATRGCGERGTLLHCWWKGKLVQPLWRIIWRLLQKLKLELPYDPCNPLSTHLEKTKTLIWKDTYTPVFTAVLFTIVKAWKQPKCPSTEEWIKMWYIYTMDYYSDTKRMK